MIYCKRYNSGTARKKGCTGQGMWDRAWRFHAFFRRITFPAPPSVQQPRSHLNVSQGFLWRLMLLTWLIKSLAINDWFNLSSPPGEVGRELNVSTQITVVHCPSNQLHPGGVGGGGVQDSPHYHKLRSGLKTGSLWITKDIHFTFMALDLLQKLGTEI